MFKLVPYLSIPRGLATKIVKDNIDLKNITTLYQLKALYNGGIILKIKDRYETIAKELGYGKTKLRENINNLVNWGLASYEHGNLSLKNKYHLTERYGVSKYCYKVSITQNDLQNLEAVFKALAIYEAQQRQVFRITHKLIANQIREEGKTKPQAPEKVKSLVRKNIRVNWEKIMEKKTLAFLRGLVSDKKPFSQAQAFTSKKPINPLCSFSRIGVARILGKSSKSTGSRIMDDLISLGYATELNHALPVEKIEEEGFKVKYKESNPAYSFESQIVYYNLYRSITITLPVEDRKKIFIDKTIQNTDETINKFKAYRLATLNGKKNRSKKG